MAAVSLVAPPRQAFCNSRFNKRCRLQKRQSFQPETGFFAGIMSKLIRLYVLVRLSNPGGYTSYRILQRDFLYRGVQQKLHKFQSLFCLSLPFRIFFVPMQTGATNVSTRWKSYQHIPAVIDYVPNITFVMRPGALGIEQITRDGIVPPFYKLISDNT